MKKLLFWAGFAAVLLTSCQEEKDYKENAGGANEVAFILQGGAATRANDAVESVPVREGISKEIAQIGDQKLFLEETIVDLNAINAETRGTPLYTENLGHIYRDKLFVKAIGFGFNQDAVFKQNDDAPTDGAWRYSFDFPVNIWADKAAPVEFYLRMPSDMGDHGVSNFEYYGGKTSFDYKSPATAVNQQDIVFSWKKMSFNDYYAAYTTVGGVRITLYHALTGVKFAIVNDETDRTANKLQITGIEFLNLKNSGHCEVTTNASGVSTINWPTATIDPDIHIAQSIEPTEIVTYSENVQHNHFPESFYAGGVEQNLNTAAATKTFWLVPQSFTGTEATLRINYKVNNRTEYLDLKLADVLSSTTTWAAGELRTYRIRLDEVNVRIEDKVEMAEASQQTIDTPWGEKQATSYEGSEKNSVKITNTGNTDAYIRAALVGQWRTTAGDPVFGYTDFTHGVQLVDSWYVDQFVAKTYHQGKFTNLPGPNWVLNEEDGFYYYQIKVPAGQAIPATDFLFEKYVVGKCPAAAIAGDVQDIHFTLEIAVQAVSAKKLNGTDYTLAEAWARANDSE